MCDTTGFCLSMSMCLSIDRWTNVKVECDPSWQPFQGHCYRLQAEKRSWQESKRACLRGGGDLLSIHSLAELEFITKQIKQGERPGGGRGSVCLSLPLRKLGECSFLHCWPETDLSGFSPRLSSHTVPQRWKSCGLASMI